jgi:hypothetical protein
VTSRSFLRAFDARSVKTGGVLAMTTQTKVKTKATFTPGPWYDQNAWGERINIRDEASDYVLAVVDDGGHVDPEFSLDWEVMQANGRLIAAAPELCEALDAICALAARAGPIPDSEWDAAISRGIKVVEKARGK